MEDEVEDEEEMMSQRSLFTLIHKLGEQIFVIYGTVSNLANAQLAMDYGFVLEENPKDILIVEAILPSKKKDPNYNIKVTLRGY